jgi:hypothetical protein
MSCTVLYCLSWAVDGMCVPHTVHCMYRVYCSTLTLFEILLWSIRNVFDAKCSCRPKYHCTVAKEVFIFCNDWLASGGKKKKTYCTFTLIMYFGDEWNGPDMTRQLKMKANVFDPGSSKSRRALAYLIIDALNSVRRHVFVFLQ